MSHFSFKQETVYEVSYIHTESLLRRYNWTKFLTIKSSPLQGLSIKWMLQGRIIKKEELIPWVLRDPVRPSKKSHTGQAAFAASSFSSWLNNIIFK